MPDNWITVIPEDPNFIPNASCQSRAQEWLKCVAPNAETIETKVNREVEFYDCGTNFEQVICPSCLSMIPIGWWQERMDEDFDLGFGFRLLKYPTPCCRTLYTLHDLVYEWPQGFGRFALEAMNPGIGKFDERQCRELQEILGTPIRIIYRHI